MSKPNVWQKREVNLRPYGTINAGEEKLEKISDAGAKMTLRQVAEDNIAAHQPATDDTWYAKNMKNQTTVNSAMNTEEMLTLTCCQDHILTEKNALRFMNFFDLSDRY